MRRARSGIFGSGDTGARKAPLAEAAGGAEGRVEVAEEGTDTGTRKRSKTNNEKA